MNAKANLSVGFMSSAKVLLQTLDDLAPCRSYQVSQSVAHRSCVLLGSSLYGDAVNAEWIGSPGSPFLDRETGRPRMAIRVRPPSAPCHLYG